MTSGRCFPTVLLLLAAGSVAANGELCLPQEGDDRPASPQVDAATLVVVVDGMMKSRSGAT